MIVLGISPLDKDATAALVVDGKVVFAAGEERFSRQKQHVGFPWQAIEHALKWGGVTTKDVDLVAYPFLTAAQEADLITKAFAANEAFERESHDQGLVGQLRAALARVPERKQAIPGLGHPNERLPKGLVKETYYRLVGGGSGLARNKALALAQQWQTAAIEAHRRHEADLLAGLQKLGLGTKLRRCEHHLSHAANAFLSSGFERALIVTFDGYGSGKAGSISVGTRGRIQRVHDFAFPHSLGTMYENVTGALGFRPDRHAGKIVGLAAYGDPAVLGPVLLSRIEQRDGDFRIRQNLNVRFTQNLTSRFPKVDVAAAYQHVLEVVACNVVAHWSKQLGLRDVVLSGGVTANVKLNQRIHALDGIDRTFVYPDMGDGGCGTGLALQLSWPEGKVEPIRDVYLGPSYTDAEIKTALEQEGLRFTQPASIAAEVARRIHAGEVIGRFDGRMEYGPRALGNRSVLYHAREPEVNQWLNKRLGRTEFMPFAPVTLWEARERCYVGLEGAEHAAEFMTITFDCTPWMRAQCPAAVHVDGTARPQLIRREINPGYHAILTEYEKLSGIPTLINTSFNMHEEPIVCSPRDAIRAFLAGRIDGLAIGPYFVEHPERAKA
ncbi:MAG: carbamoyltransferase [Planctomycetes bacterium]|nr:carbamoyltransferase [Planctomycetota bacterium]